MQIANDELRHYEIWKKFTDRKSKPSRWKMFKYYCISRFFGLTFGFKLMKKEKKKHRLIIRIYLYHYCVFINSFLPSNFKSFHFPGPYNSYCCFYYLYFQFLYFYYQRLKLYLVPRSLLFFINLGISVLSFGIVFVLNHFLKN